MESSTGGEKVKVSGIHERDGYVAAAFEGEFSSSDIEAIFAACVKATALKGGTRLLIDFRNLTTEAITTLDRYQLGLFGSRLPKGGRYACLIPPRWTDPQNFGARVARNRGAVVDVFSSERQALAWLLRPEEPPAPDAEK